jgi:hypothetical protein
MIRLVLFPNLTRIISLEVVAAFIAYENAQINSTSRNYPNTQPL